MRLRRSPRPIKYISIVAGLGLTSFIGFRCLSNHDTTAPCISANTDGFQIIITTQDDYSRCPVENSASDEFLKMSQESYVERKDHYSNIKSLEISIDHYQLEPQDIADNAPAVKTKISYPFSLGKHSLEVLATDSKGNTRFFEYNVFAYGNIVVPYSDIEQDLTIPDINNEGLSIGPKGRIFFNKFTIEDRGSGIKEIIIYENEKRITSKRYNDFTPRVNLRDQISALRLNPSSTITIEVFDQRNNFANYIINYNKFDGIADYSMGGN